LNLSLVYGKNRDAAPLRRRIASLKRRAGGVYTETATVFQNKNKE
jgi:hypothetical protein